MFYKFPEINHIIDVLPHIEGRNEFRIFDKEWYKVINYVVAFEETFQWDDNDPVGSAIRRECRGLVFNQDGVIISRPFHKFFNVDEKDETQTNQCFEWKDHPLL